MYYDIEPIFSLMKWTLAAGLALMAFLLLFDRRKAARQAEDSEARHNEVIALLKKIEHNTRTEQESRDGGEPEDPATEL